MRFPSSMVALALCATLCACSNPGSSIAVAISVQEGAPTPSVLRVGIYNSDGKLLLPDDLTQFMLPGTIYADLPGITGELRVSVIGIADTGTKIRGATSLEVLPDRINRGAVVLSPNTTDFDDDDVPDSIDNCPTVPNRDQANSDGMAEGDVCADVDGGVPDLTQPCVPQTQCTLACGSYPDGCGGTLECGACQLVSLHPREAKTGTTLTLEGTFAEPATVTFPGGVPIAATLLGAHRATVVVPNSATAGNLTVESGHQTTSPLYFRHTTFDIGLASYIGVHYAQTEAARSMAVPATNREGASGLVLGKYLYVIGGSTGSPVATSERARINADGTLQGFVAGPALVTARTDAAFVHTGTRVHLIGGSDGTALSSVESALDGTAGLGDFATSSAALTQARHGACAVAVGNFVYVIGGRDSSDVSTIERASINGDNTLATFATVAGVTLAQPRSRHACIVSGDTLYVVGGVTTSNTFLTSIERAPIMSDGTLGPFVADASLTTARAGAVVLALGGRLYAYGGQTGTSSFTAGGESAAINADGTLGGFTGTLNTLKTARRSAVAAIASNTLYIIGGTGVGGIISMQPVEHTSIIEAGLLESFGMIGITTAPARANIRAVALGDHLYLFGGSTGPSPLATLARSTVHDDGSIESFNGFNTVTLTTRHSGHLAVFGTTLFIGGGNTGSPTTGSELFSIAENGDLSNAGAGPTLATARVFARIFAIGTSLYVAGGSGAGFLSSVDAATISGSSLGAFATVGGITYTGARWAAPGAVLGNDVYTFAGSNGSMDVGSNQVATISVGNNAINTFANVDTLTPRNAHTAVVVGPSVYLIGAVGMTSTMERANYDATGDVQAFGSYSISNTPTARTGQAAIALGNYVYLIGGRNTDMMMAESSAIERSEIH